MKTVIIFLHLILIYNTADGQTSSNRNDILKPKPPKDSVNILYYHFYNGIQMVELDYQSPYNENVAYHDFPFRDIPYSATIPPPRPNVYLFRDTLGNILKSYNLYGLKVEKLKLIPPKKLIEKDMVFHGGKNYLRTAETRRYYLYNENAQSRPHDIYIFMKGGKLGVNDAMYGGTLLEGAKWGIIDTTGTIILNATYDYISDFETSITTVALGRKLGLINNKGTELLSCIYDDISIQENVEIAYLEKKLSIYNTKGKKINVNNYEGEINFYKGTSRVFIKGKGYGIIDTKGNEICPLEYDIIEELPQDHLDGKRYYYARKSGKEFYISQKGEVTEK